jgi:hypothetical protein
MSTARSNRCRAPAFCNWSNGNERRCRDPRCRGDGIDPLTLNQRVQGSSPCAPTIKSITRESLPRNKVGTICIRSNFGPLCTCPDAQASRQSACPSFSTPVPPLRATSRSAPQRCRQSGSPPQILGHRRHVIGVGQAYGAFGQQIAQLDFAEPGQREIEAIELLIGPQQIGQSDPGQRLIGDRRDRQQLEARPVMFAARPTRQPDGRRDDAAALSGQSTALYQDEGLEEGILKDAIRFVPSSSRSPRPPSAKLEQLPG